MRPVGQGTGAVAAGGAAQQRAPCRALEEGLASQEEWERAVEAALRGIDDGAMEKVVLARRVVCRVREGETVRTGDRFGLMKFGSRMDVFLPMSAELVVEVGATVRAAESIIAVLH